MKPDLSALDFPPEPSRRSGLAFLAFAGAIAMAVWIAGQSSQSGELLPADHRASLAGVMVSGLDGSRVDLGQARPRPLVVNLWATWCGPCKQEIPLLERLAKSGQPIIGVSIDDEPRGALKTFLANRTIGFDVAVPGPQFRVPGGIEAVPTTLLVDRQGRVAKRYIGVVNLRALTDDLKKVEAEN